MEKQHQKCWTALTIGFILFGSSILQAAPILIDFDMTGRPLAEGNEPGYTSWAVGETTGSVSMTVNGAKFTLARNGDAGTGIKSAYYKAGVQAPNYARLIGDALFVVDGNAGASIRVTISGLSAGIHTLQAYHNSIDANQHGNIKVVVNGTTVISSQPQTYQKLVVDQAASSFVTFTVTAGQTVTVDYTSLKTGGSYNNVYINNLNLDVSNPKAQASGEFPPNRDYHVDADAGSVTLSWKAASGAKLHGVYLGTDSAAVAKATTSSAEYKGSQTTTTYTVLKPSNLKIYWWRIDETDVNGVVTPGKLWSFSPRHDAFPGAQGYGRYARGGRGGKVVHVTNLNDAGAGSLREAVENDIGPRTIVFDVGGLITLKSRLVLAGNYVTVAGQTAPGKGICIRYAPFGLSGNNDCIIRFMKVRLGYGEPHITYDGMGMQGCDYCIIDHASISWTIDEAFSSRSGKNITLQRTMLAEALNNADHQNYPAGTEHGYAATIGGDVGSFHHNLLAHCEGRNWSMGGGLDGNGYYAGRLDIFNNVVYNWGDRATDGGAHEVNFVNNYYKEGAATKLHRMLTAQLEGTGKGSQSYYYSGNILQDKSGNFTCNGTDNSCGRTYTLSNGQVLDWTLWASKPFFPSYATIQSAKEAYKNVLSDVGMTMPLFDDHDKRIIKETVTGTYTYKGSKTGKAGLPDHEKDVGGYENYPTITRPADFDTDKDGLPNWYEVYIGTNASSSFGEFSDANADPDGDGYTNLEDYLNWMATPHADVKIGSSTTFNLASLFCGYTSSPTYTVGSNSALIISIKDSILTVTPKANCGIVYLPVTVKDKEGSTMTRDIGIFVLGSTGLKTEIITNKFGNPEWRIHPNAISFRAPVEGKISLYDVAGRLNISIHIKANQWHALPPLGPQVRIAIFKGKGGVYLKRVLDPMAGYANNFQ